MRLYRADVAKRHAKSGDDQGGIEDLMHGPADDAPGEQIQDRDQIQPALTGEHASGIGGPDLIEPLHGETSQSVRGNGSAVAAVSGSALDIWSVAERRVAPCASAGRCGCVFPGQPSA